MNQFTTYPHTETLQSNKLIRTQARERDQKIAESRLGWEQGRHWRGKILTKTEINSNGFVMPMVSPNITAYTHEKSIQTFSLLTTISNLYAFYFYTVLIHSYLLLFCLHPYWIFSLQSDFGHNFQRKARLGGEKATLHYSLKLCYK